MTGAELHRRLSEPFAAADVEWRVTKVRSQSSEGLAVAFIDSRAIQNRLDDVVGPFCWRTRFIPWHQYMSTKPGKYEDPNEAQKTPVFSFARSVLSRSLLWLACLTYSSTAAF